MSAQPRGALVVTTPSDRDIVMTRTFAAPPSLVWECMTTPTLVRRWLLGPPGWEMPVCEIDLRPGGSYRYLWRHPDGREFGMGGSFHEIAPPHRLVSTERFGDGEASVVHQLSESAGRTTLTLSMRFADRTARDGALKTGMTDGVEMSYQRLDAILARPPISERSAMTGSKAS